MLGPGSKSSSNQSEGSTRHLSLELLDDSVGDLVQNVLHVLSALERPDAVDEANLLKLQTQQK